MIDDGTGLFTIGKPARPTGPASRAGGRPGDADRTAVLDRLTAAANERVGRYRRWSAIVNGLGSLLAHVEESSWVVAALRAHQGR
ncbi:hypothetical protein OG440_10965 [Streptomyces sp. NBC_00637]|uniref:hypothetical protein n=1 Tax=Streptomyces sp. NBC_00637 TaxID=2903667 RepID=UPI0032449315